MTPARRHFIYSYLLNECLYLSPGDIRYLVHHGIASDERDAYQSGIRSLPTEFGESLATHAIVEAFGVELQGIAGFYLKTYEIEVSDFPEETKRLLVPQLGPLMTIRWAINLSPKQGQFIKPYYNDMGRIAGLRVFRGAYDHNPKLLTSEELICGTSPEPFKFTERNIAA